MRFLATALVALSLTACGSSDDATDEDSSEPTATASAPAQGGPGDGPMDEERLRALDPRVFVPLVHRPSHDAREWPDLDRPAHAA